MSATRRVRLDVPIVSHLETFRHGNSGDAMRNALAQIAMRLVDAEDRELFQRADGVTTLLVMLIESRLRDHLRGADCAAVDHLARISEEQATLANAWRESKVFGSTWTEHEVHDSLALTLVSICHASIDANTAKEMNEMHAIPLLLKLAHELPSASLHACQLYALECIRNLSFLEPDWTLLPASFTDDLWLALLGSHQTQRQEVLADILANIVFHGPTLINATQSRIASILTKFFAATGASTLQIALTDLLCNLCCNPAYCLILIYELDERKPPSYHRHSGAVYFTDITEKTVDCALRQSMEALAHNISWSDPSGKRSIQKLGLSSYLRLFAAEPAINN